MNDQIELDALRILLTRENSFAPQYRYLKPSHECMIPLLIHFDQYFSVKGLRNIDRKRDLRLRMVSYICQENITTFYDLTYYQVKTIADFLFHLEEGEGLARKFKFLEFVETFS